MQTAVSHIIAHLTNENCTLHKLFGSLFADNLSLLFSMASRYHVKL